MMDEQNQNRAAGPRAAGAQRGERHSGGVSRAQGSDRRNGSAAARHAQSGERSSSGAPHAQSGERQHGDRRNDGAPRTQRDGRPTAGHMRRPSDGDRRSEPRYGRPAGAAGIHGVQRTHHRPSDARPQEHTGVTMDARRAALNVLTDVHRDGAYASLALDKHLRASRLQPADRRLATALVYGTLENELRIDYALDKLMDHPVREMVQRDILRLSAYQILFLDRVPDSAAVNEAVKLVKLLGMESASGFINAVLRNLSRGKESIEWPRREDGLCAYLSVMGSMPEWLVERLSADYGEGEAERVILYREKEHPIVIRPNLTRMDDAAFEQLLSSKAWRAERGLAPHAWLVYGAGELTLDNDYRKGLFSIQGQSSILAAEAVQVKPGMKVLDACAAPGGKSAYLCEKMQLTGRVYAWELHEKRAQLLEGVRRRLGLDNLRISVRDAADPRPDLDGALDAVLLDAPCAGLGVLSQKPDVKLRLKSEDIPAIVETQRKLLDTVCRYVRPGGTLVYSTCSLLPEENSLQIQAFLERHPGFALEPLPLSFPEELRRRQTPNGLQLLGCRDGVEGFFIARMKRVR